MSDRPIDRSGAAAAVPAGGPSPSGIVVYGARTCEDTAIARSRLDALGVPYEVIDIDDDPAGLARVIELEGHRVTPTIVFGDGATVVSEPSIERLDELLRADGVTITQPRAEAIHGALADRPIPFRTLARVGGYGGGEFSLEAWRGHHATAVLFAHDAGCRACHGYAKQLAGHAPSMREADALPLIVVRDTVVAADRWSDELPDGTVVLADPDGAWADAVRRALDLPGGVALLVLDRYAASRAVSVADESGGLVGPRDVSEWLRFIALDCPECGNDVHWPD